MHDIANIIYHRVQYGDYLVNSFLNTRMIFWIRAVAEKRCSPELRIAHKICIFWWHKNIDYIIIYKTENLYYLRQTLQHLIFII